MGHGYFDKALEAVIWIGGLGAATNVFAQSQGGYGPGSGMMDGYGAGWMGGYGMGLPILLVIVVAGLVAWVISQKKK